MLSIIYQYRIQNEKKPRKRSAKQCVWHLLRFLESLFIIVQGRIFYDISFCLHSNQSLKYAISPQKKRNCIYAVNSRSHGEGPYSVHPRNMARYQC